MKNKKIIRTIFSLLAVLMLTACTADNEEKDPKKETTDNQAEQNENTNMDSDSHANMEHSSSGEVPEKLKIAEHPTYDIGTHAIIETDHMEGMKGAEATIVGAYDTTAYSISYTPTNGGEPVKDHKWVIHEEIKDAGEAPLESGTEVTIEASHMKGMEGATGVIDSAEETTVYMVDYTSTNDGDEVKNHKWVTENELSPIE
ncbi:YdhK family protein [Lederbergia lenta]|uniref:Lipoprotein, putative n=1 Tax=Lederbergia lenta TaxID=1467 RepID=A0A2X4W253_LEDLE|nr:YdhK family protein [Lederbergia lenta]MEC2324681.1 YdhK family protein [Lederbergia lenta]SQI58667.1 lipoprotein, putative [Lederbergia lenta]